MRRKVVLTLCSMVIGMQASINADEIGDLKQQLVIMQQRLEQLESAQKRQEEQIDEKVAKAVEQEHISKASESLKWAEKITFGGDFRFRYEMVDEENRENRNSNRIRARLGLAAEVNENIHTGFRVVTAQNLGDDGAGDMVSTNQTLGDAFSKKSVWLDLAYFDWHPAAYTRLHVIGGKMENPFYRAGGNQLIWDSDLTPEGLVVYYPLAIAESQEFFFNGGGFYADEVKSGADTGLLGLQAGLKHTFEDKSCIVAGTSLYYFRNIEGREAFVTDNGSNRFFGNSNGGGLYSNDYDLRELFTEYGFNLGHTQTAIFADYVQNASADSNNDSGWLIGGKYGKCKDPGSWELSYDYRYLAADAVVGAFSDSDFIGGGTNGKGHRIGAVYQLSKNTQASVNYFLNEKGSEDTLYQRFQADLIFKF